MKSFEAIHIPITEEIDVSVCVREVQKTLQQIGFKPAEVCMVATVASELARNIYRYAPPGEIVLSGVESAGRRGVQIEAKDHGNGIEDIDQAFQDQFTTKKNSLGVGLPGVKRIMDELEVDSSSSRGTQIVVRKWLI